MNNEKIESKIKLSNDSSFRYFNIRNFEIPKYWSFYIPLFKILTHNLREQSMAAENFRVLNNSFKNFFSSFERLFL